MEILEYLRLSTKSRTSDMPITLDMKYLLDGILGESNKKAINLQ
jgi:hypothetical protein